MAFLYEVRPNVRLAAALATLLSAALYATWPRTARWLAGPVERAALGLLVATLVAAGRSRSPSSGPPAGRTRTTPPHSSSAGRCRPARSYHGKLANGLALENRIKPVVRRREFGNYADRRSATMCDIF